MNVSLALVQLALIFLPGIIWASLDARFAAKRKHSQFELTLNAFMFGVASYVLTFGFYMVVGWDFDVVAGVDLERGIGGLERGADEIAAAVLAATVAAVLWLYGATYKLLPKFLMWIRATKKYGDEDVWDYILNSDSPMVEFINIRDFDKKIVYAGYIRVSSESDRQRELLLREVEVYDFEGLKMFDMPYIYISRRSDDLHIEFPFGTSGKELQNAPGQ